MILPTTPPDADQEALWELQCELLSLAENLLGPRDSSKRIFLPTFALDGPFLRNTPQLDGAFAELSLNAARSWRTAIYELGHETVHLLNPTVMHTNRLEEGVAVAFSAHALAHYGCKPHPPKLATYVEALGLVEELRAGRSFLLGLHGKRLGH